MAAKRGRRPGFVMSDEHRTKIQNSQILNALVEHAEGRRDMSSTQVQAGLGLLRKIMPDCAALDVTGMMQHQHEVGERTKEAVDDLIGKLARLAARSGESGDPKGDDA